MNNKEIAEQLRKIADELDGDASCIRSYTRIVHVLHDPDIQCEIKTSSGCAKVNKCY